MSDDTQGERTARRGCDALPCARCGRLPGGPCPLDAPGELMPYRPVARYRGDRVGRSFGPQAWDRLGRLADDDPSWPTARVN